MTTLDEDDAALLRFGPLDGYPLRSRTRHLYVPAPKGLSRDAAYRLRERGWVSEERSNGHQTLVVLTAEGERRLDQLLAEAPLAATTVSS